MMACAVAVQLANRDHDPERVQEACRDTLRDLQIEQLDLYLMHWPVTSNTGPTLSPPIEVHHPSCNPVDLNTSRGEASIGVTVLGMRAAQCGGLRMAGDESC